MYQPKRKNLRRDNVIAVRISEAEFERIKRNASEAQLTLSSWCREIIKDYLELQAETLPKKAKKK